MANATVNTTYVGQLATPFVAPAILSADSIANGYVSVLENVRHEAVLKKFSGGTIAARSCEFTTPATGMVLGDVTLTTTQLQVNEQICNKDLAQDWAAAQMRGADASAPNAYANFISQYVSRIVAKDVEKNMWQGNYDPLGAGGVPSVTSFNGLMQLYAASSETNNTDVAGAFTALSPSSGTDTGIATHLIQLIANMPDDIEGDPDTKIFMSRKTFSLYYRYLASNNNNPVLAQEVAKFYLGYEVIVPAGFPDDCLLATKIDNIYFGTNVLTDMIEARILDLTAVTGDAVTRVAMMFDAGCQIVDEASAAAVQRTS